MALTIRSLIDLLRALPRLGAQEDAPEGVRYIQFSDTLALRIADDLEKILAEVRSSTYFEPGDFGYGYSAALDRVLEIIDPTPPKE